ncbi:hypothetical protein T10_11297 [Trichinella papuae]|uniref:Transmembrane protein n=1 Tax=Trichinella papuae TaxID=268474 RepID=A0A0V1N872_9BILA|nr:hypothetical protein T10_11297 [Trichinella papuae]
MQAINLKFINETIFPLLLYCCFVLFVANGCSLLWGRFLLALLLLAQPILITFNVSLFGENIRHTHALRGGEFSLFNADVSVDDGSSVSTPTVAPDDALLEWKEKRVQSVSNIRQWFIPWPTWRIVSITTNDIMASTVAVRLKAKYLT